MAKTKRQYFRRVFMVSGFWFLVSGLRFQVSGFWFQGVCDTPVLKAAGFAEAHFEGGIG